MKKKFLGVLLSAALLASMALPTGVTAAEVTEAVGEAATTVTEAVTTAVAEVSGTMKTVEADPYTATYTTGGYTYTATVLDDCSDFTGSSIGAAALKGTGNAPTSLSYSIGDADTDTGIGIYGSGFRGFTITVDCSSISETETEGLYFELLDVYGGISGLGNTASEKNFANELTLKVGSDSRYEPINVQVSLSTFLSYTDAYNCTTSLSGTYGTATYTNQGILTQFYIPWTKLNTTSAAVQAAGSYTFTICFLDGQVSGTLTGSDGTAYTGSLMCDNFGVYTKTEAAGETSSEETSSTETSSEASSEASSEETTLEDVREDKSVTVIQDFEYATASSDGEASTDVLCDGSGTVTPEIGTTYLDGNTAQFTVTASGPQNLRMQTTAVALAGEGLYFEVQTSGTLNTTGNMQLQLYDSTSAQNQANDTSLTPIGTITKDSTPTLGSCFNTVTQSNTYYVMIPWSALGIDDISDVTINNGLSVKLWVGGPVATANLVIAIDNIGFYGMTASDYTLGASSDTNTATTTTIYGYGSDTIYAKVSTTDIASYSNDNYPTTGLAYGDNGYIFAGWYEDGVGSTACTKMPETEAYAKFIDADVLQVGFQTTQKDEDGYYSLRFVSTVDNLKYTSTGFVVSLDGSTPASIATYEVYETIYAVDKDYTSKVYDTAKSVFSTASTYFSTAALINISYDDYENCVISSVFAYLETLDGTTVIYSVPTTSVTGTDGVVFGTTTLGALYEKAWGTTSSDE